MQIANEILRQLGGTGRLKAMINANAFVAIHEGQGLQFWCMKGNRVINMVQIVLNGRDLYDVKFMKRRGFNEPTVVAIENDVYVDGLAAAFWEHAGLAIRLNERKQA